MYPTQGMLSPFGAMTPNQYNSPYQQQLTPQMTPQQFQNNSKQKLRINQSGDMESRDSDPALEADEIYRNPMQTPPISQQHQNQMPQQQQFYQSMPQQHQMQGQPQMMQPQNHQYVLVQTPQGLIPMPVITQQQFPQFQQQMAQTGHMQPQFFNPMYPPQQQFMPNQMGFHSPSIQQPRGRSTKVPKKQQNLSNTTGGKKTKDELRHKSVQDLKKKGSPIKPPFAPEVGTSQDNLAGTLKSAQSKKFVKSGGKLSSSRSPSVRRSTISSRQKIENKSSNVKDQIKNQLAQLQELQQKISSKKNDKALKQETVERAAYEFEKQTSNKPRVRVGAEKVKKVFGQQVEYRQNFSSQTSLGFDGERVQNNQEAIEYEEEENDQIEVHPQSKGKDRVQPLILNLDQKSPNMSSSQKSSLPSSFRNHVAKVKKEFPRVDAANTGIKSVSVTPRVEDSRNQASRNASDQSLDPALKGNQTSVHIPTHAGLDLPTVNSHSRKSMQGSVVTQQKRTTPVIVARGEMPLAGTRVADHLDQNRSEQSSSIKVSAKSSSVQSLPRTKIIVKNDKGSSDRFAQHLDTKEEKTLKTAQQEDTQMINLALEEPTQMSKGSVKDAVEDDSQYQLEVIEPSTQQILQPNAEEKEAISIAESSPEVAKKAQPQPQVIYQQPPLQKMNTLRMSNVVNIAIFQEKEEQIKEEEALLLDVEDQKNEAPVLPPPISEIVVQAKLVAEVDIEPIQATEEEVEQQRLMQQIEEEQEIINIATEEETKLDLQQNLGEQNEEISRELDEEELDQLELEEEIAQMMPTPPQKQEEEQEQSLAIVLQEEEKQDVVQSPVQLQEPNSPKTPVEAVEEEQGEELQQLQEEEEEMIIQETQQEVVAVAEAQQPLDSQSQVQQEVEEPEIQQHQEQSPPQVQLKESQEEEDLVIEAVNKQFDQEIQPPQLIEPDLRPSITQSVATQQIPQAQQQEPKEAMDQTLKTPVPALVEKTQEIAVEHPSTPEKIQEPMPAPIETEQPKTPPGQVEEEKLEVAESSQTPSKLPGAVDPFESADIDKDSQAASVENEVVFEIEQEAVNQDPPEVAQIPQEENVVETVNQIQQPEEEDAVSQSAPLAMPNPAEMRLLKELFQSLDADGGGTLTLEEIKAGLQGREDADYIYQLLADADADGSGEIDYEEFLAATTGSNIFSEEQLLGLSIRNELKASVREEAPQLVELVEEEAPPEVQEAQVLPPPDAGPSEVIQQQQEEEQPSGEQEMEGQVLFITEQREMKEPLKEFPVLNQKTLRSEQMQSMVEPEELMDEETEEWQEEEAPADQDHEEQEVVVSGGEQAIIVPDVEQRSQNLYESGNKFHEISDSMAPHSEVQIPLKVEIPPTPIQEISVNENVAVKQEDLETPKQELSHVQMVNIDKSPKLQKEADEPTVSRFGDVPCLPDFNYITKEKSYFELVEYCIESDDTDGYLEDQNQYGSQLFGPKSQQQIRDQKSPEDSIYDSIQIAKDKENVPVQGGQPSNGSASGSSAAKLKMNELKVQKGPSTSSKKMMIDKVKKQNAKKSSSPSRSRSKSHRQKMKNKKAKKHDEDCVQTHNVRYQRLSAHQTQEQMLKTQRIILNHVQDMHKIKNKDFLIKYSEGNLYEYIQQYKEEVKIDTKGILRISDPRKIYFEIFVIILAIYNCFGIPFEICFKPEVMENTSFLILNTIIDFIFLIDIIVQFKTTYYDPLSGDEIFDKEIIKWNYLKGRFLIDILATVPFDNIVFLITKTRSAILPLFSLLKLIRVTRLGRIIEKMNVKEHIKLMMKLSQLIFFLIMYIHCQACVWYLIVNQEQNWVPPLDGISPDNFLFDDSLSRKYLICVYYSILLLTCNDITPVGEWKIFFCTSAITLGAIINADIFGTMALIIQNLNIKNTEFQESIDLANTAMKNMNMPNQLQKDVVSYLQYTQQFQNGQLEFEFFFQSLSPSLKNQVIQFIFNDQAFECFIFEKNKILIDFFIRSMALQLLDPEYPLVNQGEDGDTFYFVKTGELQVFVKDPIEKRDIFVRSLRPGDFFGEYSLITKQARSASVRPKNYAMVGYLAQEKFEEMIFMFPELRTRLKNHFFTYDDQYKIWQIDQLRNIQYMKYLTDRMAQELTIILTPEIFDENQEIFKEGDIPGKIYILVQGTLELYLTITDGELILDTLKYSGSVLNQVSILTKLKMTYSVRAKTDVEMLTITKEDLYRYKEKAQMSDLKKAIEKFEKSEIEGKNLTDRLERQYYLDYQKPSLFKRQSSMHIPLSKIELFRAAGERCLSMVRFHCKKDNILSDLIAELKKQNLNEEQKNLNKMKELVKSVGPIVISKLKKLISNRIKVVQTDSIQQSHQIRSIAQIVQLLSDQHIMNTNCSRVDAESVGSSYREETNSIADSQSDHKKAKKRDKSKFVEEVQNVDDDQSSDNGLEDQSGRHQIKQSHNQNSSPKKKSFMAIPNMQEVMENSDEDKDSNTSYSQKNRERRERNREHKKSSRKQSKDDVSNRGPKKAKKKR